MITPLRVRGLLASVAILLVVASSPARAADAKPSETAVAKVESAPLDGETPVTRIEVTRVTVQ